MNILEYWLVFTVSTFLSIISNKKIRDWKRQESFSNLLYLICYSIVIHSSNIFFLCYCIIHKSVFIFGLLASSLVMLAVVPFLNNNAAMAKEYGGNSYSTYSANDKKYEYRTGPFEGFL